MSESRNIKGAIKHVKVDTSGLKRASADYKDYQRVYAVLHLIAYSKKYGYLRKRRSGESMQAVLKEILGKQ